MMATAKAPFLIRNLKKSERRVGGKVTHDDLFSNKLIRVKSLLEEDYEAEASSVRPSS